jgi:hypothetical protein
MDPLAHLTNCRDVAEVRDRLTRICAGFGAIVRLDILTAGQGGQPEALCFLRLETAAQENRFMHELGVGRFAGDLIVVAGLQAGAANSAAMALHPERGPARLAA